MRAGELRERVELQANTPTRDGFGAEVAHWATMATVWAKVVAESGSEQINQVAGVATTIYTITLRDRDDVDTTMQVLYEGLTLQIRAVLAGDVTGVMRLDCREVKR